MGNGTLYFHETPRNTTLTRCAEYSENTCCTTAYAEAIAAHQDLFARDLQSQLNNIPAQCEEDFRKITCSPCAPDSDVYYSHVWGDYFNLYVCRSFCQKMYISCGSATHVPSGQLVSQHYGNGDMFCNGVFTPTSIWGYVLPDSDRHCLDPLTRDCTADDVAFHYSECVNGHRDLVYSWKPNRTCTAGLVLPENVLGLPCPLDCPAGSYLPLGTSLCQTCPAGYYSLGGGHRIDKWDTWPTRYIPLTTYCTDADDHVLNASLCSGWRLGEEFVESNIGGRASTKSVLLSSVILDHDGSVSFEARVDAEAGFDKLIFFIDAAEYIIPNSLSPREYTYPLSRGPHTLKWVYSKDATVDRGTDSAMLFTITVTALSNHNDYCIDCPAGTSSLAGASSCVKCRANEYTPHDGMPACLPCPADKYSFPGSDECLPRQPCTASDYKAFHGMCHANHTRTTFYRWLEPRICLETTVHLPPTNYSAECADCNPGFYRKGDDCEVCPEGEYSDVGTEHACRPCPPGTEASKSLDLIMWDEWPDGATHSCTGDCGVTQWRLLSDYIDSGIDHGGYVDIAFTIPVYIEEEPHGDLYVDFQLLCNASCYFEIWDADRYLTSTWGGSPYSEAMRSRGPLRLNPGNHNLTFIFGKWYSQRNNDRVVVHRILIEGVREGGATQCAPCAPGTISLGRVSNCTLCPPGSSSPGNGTACSPCPANTHNPSPGGRCRNCGAGIVTPPGSTSCGADQCHFAPPGTPDVYDLSPLSRRDREWGPVVESASYYYYLNPCQRNVTNSSCLSSSGAPLNTHVCQYFPGSRYAVDIGNSKGFYPSPAPGSTGFIMEFTGGAPGCANPWTGAPAVMRKTNVTFICDPSAGVGQPEPADNLHPAPCVFALQWRSVYACPLCRPDHIIPVPGPCIDGKQQTSYQWLTNPKACHAGVPLPAPVTGNCSRTQSCPVGTFLTGADACQSCPEAHYSLGNGEAYSNWPDRATLDPFTSTCESADCSGWTIEDGLLKSGNGVSSLQVIKNFNSAAATTFIEFKYHLSAFHSRLVFYIDNDIALDATQPSIGWESFSKPVSVGTHRFRWAFHQGPLPYPGSRREEAHLLSVLFGGSVQATVACTPCHPGHVSDSARAQCVPCDHNHYVVNGRCEPCPGGQFHLPGDEAKCAPSPACTSANWLPFTSDLENYRCGAPGAGPSTVTYLPAQPRVCSGSTPPSTRREECIPCPRGLVYQNGACRPCPAGTYATAQGCLTPTAGSFAIPEASYFFPGDIRGSLPPEFTTRCGGECGTAGWQLSPDGRADSGVHGGMVDSVLELRVNVTHGLAAAVAPRVQFKLSLSPLHGIKRAPAPGRADFIIDGRLQTLSLPSGAQDVAFSFPLPAPASGMSVGQHTLRWSYSQSIDPLPQRLSLSSLRILGAVKGGAAEASSCPAGSYIDPNGCHVCPAGTSSSAANSDHCTICSAGWVAPPGSSSCTECPKSYVPEAQSRCVPACIFGHVGEYFNLSALRAAYDVNNQFLLSPCRPVPAPSGCSGCQDAHVFRKDGAAAYSLGQLLAFQSVFYSMDDPKPHTFDLIYTESDRPPLGCGPGTVKTVVQFRCDPAAGIGAPRLDPTSAPCTPVFTWTTAHACRLCTASDLRKEFSACLAGKRDVTLRPANETCVLAWADSLPLKEACTAIEVDEYLGGAVAIGVGVVLLILLGLAIFFWKRKRDVEAKYDLLKNDYPMDDVDEDRPRRRAPPKDAPVDLDASD